MAKNCWYKKDKGAVKGKDDEGENLACQDTNDFDDMVLITTVVYEHVNSKAWFLGTGCSSHMIGRKVWLANFYESKKIKVMLVDNSSLQAEVTGNIVIQRINGEKAMIKDVLYMSCPNLTLAIHSSKVYA